MTPTEILFLDDIEQNVQAARSFGIHAVQVRGILEVIDALTASHFDVDIDVTQEETDYHVAEVQDLSRR